MPVFEFHFTVPSSRAAVAAFHHDTAVLRWLTPPPIIVQLRAVEPLAEGSRAAFTLWFGPLPVRWVAVHQDVGPTGFTDRQLQGPMRRWEHQHHFEALGPDRTLVRERIVYEHPAGWRGWVTRLLFNQLNLRLMFHYRAWITRLGVARLVGRDPAPSQL